MRGSERRPFIAPAVIIGSSYARIADPSHTSLTYLSLSHASPSLRVQNHRAYRHTVPTASHGGACSRHVLSMPSIFFLGIVTPAGADRLRAAHLDQRQASSWCRNRHSMHACRLNGGTVAAMEAVCLLLCLTMAFDTCISMAR